jgi:hypothetical protein
MTFQHNTVKKPSHLKKEIEDSVLRISLTPMLPCCFPRNFLKQYNFKVFR